MLLAARPGSLPPATTSDEARRRASGKPQQLTDQTPATAQPGRVHVVREGDTLWVIAGRYDVSVERLAAANGIDEESILALGKRLSIPAGKDSTAASSPATTRRARPGSTDGPPLRHTVGSGDSPWIIARRYGIKVEDLLEANALSEEARIHPGQRLAIPGRRAQAGGANAARRPRTGAAGAPSRVDATESRATRRVGFIWPSRGILTSRFGMRYRRHHNGIDIASPTGTSIYAARDGVVTFAGRRGGYGLVVYVDHGDGFTTVYGHASRVHVSVGDRVARGQLIARVGCTGSCTGSHLHFEVHEGGRPVNPLRHLR